MFNYYKVTAKFGHVGRGKYYPLDVFTKAISAKEASLNVRWMPRVKASQ